jgi:hypothetical protein
MRMKRAVELKTNRQQHAEERTARFAQRGEVTGRHRAERVARLSEAMALPPPAIDWRDCPDDPAALAHRAEGAEARREPGGARRSCRTGARPVRPPPSHACNPQDPAAA